jgi:hypothetical protein
VLILGPDSEFDFKPVDFVAKPPLENLFGIGAIQSGDGSTLPIERNMVTGDILALARLGDVVHENALRAGMSTQRTAEIQAGQRALEKRCGFQGRTNEAAISAVLDESRFEFQFLQKLARLLRPRSLPIDDQSNLASPRLWQELLALEDQSDRLVVRSYDADQHGAIRGKRVAFDSHRAGFGGHHL